MQKAFSLVLAAVALKVAISANNTPPTTTVSTTPSAIQTPHACITTTRPAYSQTTIGTITTSAFFISTGVDCGPNPSCITTTRPAYSQTTIGDLTTSVFFTSTGLVCPPGAAPTLPPPGACVTTTRPAYSQTTIGNVTTSVFFTSTGVDCGRDGPATPSIGTTSPTASPALADTLGPGVDTPGPGNLTLEGALKTDGNGVGARDTSWVGALLVGVMGAFYLV
ncbi:hypothetical protein D9611_014699 [Ephemerocybe angulata]|uniref:Uncharacterized protein n=1 Tax=Ephemerocybe angulata TaxID=980116 RepID=A0A8H5B826_9AGAR|nr:hypothetical protein D9611_014699 [Tulosesus angulatus]